MSTEKIKKIIRNKKALITSGIACVLVISTFLTLTFMFIGNTKAVALVIDGQKDIYQTEAITVQGFFEEQEIELQPEDEVSVELHSFLSDEQTIEVNTAVKMTVIDGGEKFEVTAQPGIVDEVLQATGHERGANDWVTPAYNSWVGEDAVINVHRISYAQNTVTEAVEPKLVEKEDASMPAGTMNVLQEGTPGVDEVLYESVYKNGVKIQDNEISRKTIQKSEDRIVAVGAKNAANSAVFAEAGSYSRSLTVSATAYTHTGNRTATGTVARVGIIAVDPKVIPLGTKVYVEGYGYATAEDTGGAIKGNRIDIFLNSNAECINWGRRSVKVYILD